MQRLNKSIDYSSSMDSQNQTQVLPSPTSKELINYFSFQYNFDDWTLYKSINFNIETNNQQKELQKEKGQIKIFNEENEALQLIHATLPNSQIKSDLYHQELLTVQQKSVLDKGEKRNSDLKRPKRKGYPTKNFLAQFKTTHLKYIQSHPLYSPNILINHLNQKKGISMKDYQSLYKTESFNKIWKQFFQQKHLYRSLMTAKLSLRQKIIYLSRLSVFQQSFTSQKFDHIN